MPVWSEYVGIMDFEIGRRVTLIDNDDSDYSRGAVSGKVVKDHYGNLRVSINWDSGGRHSELLEYLVPLCANCGHARDCHDKHTGKCLFGPGTWT
jgi:hypothetical protein